MEFHYECLWCHVNQAQRVAEMVGVDQATKEGLIRQVLSHLSEMPYEGSNPGLMEKTWQIITQTLRTDDPYKDVKRTFNDQMLLVYGSLQEGLLKDRNPFEKAIHLAVEGNIIDFGAKHHFSKDTTMAKLLSSEKECFALDETAELYKQLSKAKTLLYIGDNCGEIVMDKLLIRVIKDIFPNLAITFAVRGRNILNDVTLEDALQVNMAEFAEVIDNGSGAPGTELTLTSDAFNRRFNKADVMIAKGQGNFESLCDLHRPNLFFLFMAKCEAVANEVGVPLMSKLCCRS